MITTTETRCSGSIEVDVTFLMLRLIISYFFDCGIQEKPLQKLKP